MTWKRKIRKETKKKKGMDIEREKVRMTNKNMKKYTGIEK